MSIIRLEKINLKKIRSVAKIIGTAITVVGEMVVTLYKGPIIDFIKSGGAIHHGSTDESADKNWVTGTIMLLGSIFGLSSFFYFAILHVEEVPDRALSYSLDMFHGNGARCRGVPAPGYADFSILGAIIIVSVLHTVVWGKRKDGKNS
ncbi:hypothetical protein V6N13_118474 [Hibiscus sabdariffa]